MKMKKLLPLLLVLALAWSRQIVTAQTLVADDSDGPFSILAQMVTVLSPNGGENWNLGEMRNITRFFAELKFLDLQRTSLKLLAGAAAARAAAAEGARRGARGTG